ncbi:hypothetical protein WMY93_016220 [Mugilogobius chulae]|uniref:Uncharacterized protein n=1 Tax=Mugilogobius chulae TaxID=88201 RepID=A0AAW0NWN6_9GOBI
MASYAETWECNLQQLSALYRRTLQGTILRVNKSTATNCTVHRSHCSSLLRITEHHVDHPEKKTKVQGCERAGCSEPAHAIGYKDGHFAPVQLEGARSVIFPFRGREAELLGLVTRGQLSVSRQYNYTVRRPQRHRRQQGSDRREAKEALKDQPCAVASMGTEEIRVY